MFFTKLLPLLVSLDLAFDIKQKEDKIRLIVKFKMQDEKSEQINLTPLVIEALPSELDEELIDELINHLNISVPALSSQINLLTSNLKKVLEEKTKTATAKKDVKTKDAEPKKDEALNLFETKEQPKKETVAKTTIPSEPKKQTKAEVKQEPKEVVSEQPKVESKKQEVVDLFADDIDNDIVDKIELDKSEGVDLFDDEDDSDNPFA